MTVCACVAAAITERPNKSPAASLLVFISCPPSRVRITFAQKTLGFLPHVFVADDQCISRASTNGGMRSDCFNLKITIRSPSTSLPGGERGAAAVRETDMGPTCPRGGSRCLDHWSH